MTVLAGVVGDNLQRLLKAPKFGLYSTNMGNYHQCKQDNNLITTVLEGELKHQGGDGITEGTQDEKTSKTTEADQEHSLQFIL